MIDIMRGQTQTQKLSGFSSRTGKPDLNGYPGLPKV